MKASRVSQNVFLGESTAGYVDEAFARVFVMRYTTRHPTTNTHFYGARARLFARLYLGNRGGITSRRIFSSFAAKRSSKRRSANRCNR